MVEAFLHQVRPNFGHQTFECKIGEDTHMGGMNIIRIFYNGDRTPYNTSELSSNGYKPWVPVRKPIVTVKYDNKTGPMCVWECMLHAGTNLSTNLNTIGNTICKKPKGRWMQPDVISTEVSILGTHECYASNPPLGVNVGHFTGNCSITYNINTTHSCEKLPTNGDISKACITPPSASGYTPTYLLLAQTNAVPDLFWLCGNKELRSTLPPNWKGTCA